MVEMGGGVGLFELRKTRWEAPIKLALIFVCDCSLNEGLEFPTGLLLFVRASSPVGVYDELSAERAGNAGTSDNASASIKGELDQKSCL